MWTMTMMTTTMSLRARQRPSHPASGAQGRAFVALALCLACASWSCAQDSEGGPASNRAGDEANNTGDTGGDASPDARSDLGLDDAALDDAALDDAREQDASPDAGDSEGDAPDAGEDDLGGPVCPEPAPCVLGAASCLSNIYEICELDPQGCPKPRYEDCNPDDLLCVVGAGGGCAQPDDAALEPNDSPEAASPVELPAALVALASGPDDEDWYRVALPAPGVVSVDLRREARTGTVRARLCLEGQPCGPADALARLEVQGEPGRLVQRLDPETTLLVGVSAGSALPYSLLLQGAPWEDHAPTGDTFIDARPQPLPGATRAAASPSEAHWYEVELRQAGLLRAELSSGEGLLLLCDPVFPGACDEAHHEARGQGRLTEAIPGPARRFLVVKPADNAPYELYLDLLPSAQPVCDPGLHDGGGGLCVTPPACAEGFHDDGAGRCAPSGACAEGFRLGPEGACEGWRAAPTTRLPRVGARALANPEGVVLLLGGADADPTAVERLDPDASRWRDAAPLPQARANFGTCLLADGRALVVGDGPPLLYDFDADAWSIGAAPAQPRLDPACVALEDGSALVFLGGLLEAERYLPDEDRWEPAGVMNHARVKASFARLTDGRVLVASGLDADARTTAELYDPASNAWTPTRTLGAARHTSALVPLPDGSALLVGGGDGARPSALVDRFDPQTLRWNQRASMRRPRFVSGFVPLSGDRWLVVGDSFETEIYRLDPNAWSPGPPLRLGRAGASLVSLPEGRALLVGGTSNDGGDPARHPEYFE